MPNPGLPRGVLEESIKLIEQLLTEGFAPRNQGGNKPAALTEAAKRLGIAHQKMSRRIDAAERQGIFVDWSLYREPVVDVVERQAPKPRVRVRVQQEGAPEGPTYRVLAIGDLHDSPHIPNKDRFKWIGKYANEKKFPYIVQIGDWMTCDSCSQYDSRATLTGRTKPSYEQDIESLEVSIGAMVSEFEDYSPERVVTLGNHENRAYQWEDNNPEVEGMFALRMEQAFARGGFKITQFGDWYFLGGVGFTHVPLGIMGKAYGGEMPENSIANKAMFPIVYGHTHKRVLKRAPKIGPQKHITVLNLGCALPNGVTEHYIKQGQMTGWSWGVYDLLIQGGDIVSDKFISMIELEDRYVW